MLLHPIPFVMQAIPAIFQNLPADYFSTLMGKVKERVDIVQNKIREIPGLRMEVPEGSFYCMVSIDFSHLDFGTSIAFAQKLASEQGVLVMPAEAFLSANGFRIVLCQPIYVIEECMDRIKKFVESHLVN